MHSFTPHSPTRTTDFAIFILASREISKRCARQQAASCGRLHCIATVTVQYLSQFGIPRVDRSVTTLTCALQWIVGEPAISICRLAIAQNNANVSRARGPRSKRWCTSKKAFVEHLTCPDIEQQTASSGQVRFMIMPPSTGATWRAHHPQLQNRPVSRARNARRGKPGGQERKPNPRAPEASRTESVATGAAFGVPALPSSALYPCGHTVPVLGWHLWFRTPGLCRTRHRGPPGRTRHHGPSSRQQPCVVR